jgi:hypothetical protein
MALPVSNAILPPNSQVGLPSEVDFSSVGKALPNGTRSYQISVLPTGQSSFSSGTLTMPNTANTASNLSFTGGQVLFDIPTMMGGSRSSYIDTRMSYLKYKATFSNVSASTGTAPTIYTNLRGSGASLIQRYNVICGGNQIVEIGEYGVLYDSLLKIALNQSDRVSGCGSILFGLNDAPYTKSSTNINKIGNSGHVVNNMTVSASNTAVSSEVHTYALPLICPVLGSLATQMFPIGKIGSCQLQLNLDTILPLSIYPTTVPGTSAGTINYTASDWELVLTIVDFGPEAEKVLEQASSVGNKQYWKSVSYRSATATLQSGVGGTLDVLVGARGASCKSIIMRNYFSAVSTSASNDKYDSFNPALTNYQCQIGGNLFPNKPIQFNQSPASALAELQKSFTALNLTSFNTALSSLNFAKSTHTPSDTGMDWAVIATSSTNGSTPLNPAECILSIDFESMAKEGILSGINSLSSPLFVRYNISGTLPSAISSIFHLHHDIIYELDLMTGQLIASS